MDHNSAMLGQERVTWNWSGRVSRDLYPTRLMAETLLTNDRLITEEGDLLLPVYRPLIALTIC